jgi:hypothetical protein
VAETPVWEQFLNVRSGRIPNPSPPEVGLRMARLWDAIRESASRAGAVVHLPTSDPMRVQSVGRSETVGRAQAVGR